VGRSGVGIAVTGFHLTNVYRTLGIDGRRQLAAALAATGKQG
jgi:DNA-binding CsgD family transcriptional regulator